MVKETKTVRPEKEAIVNEIKAKFADATCAMLVDFKGITVSQASDIRRELCELDARLFIAKNRLIGRALKDESYLAQWQEGLSECSAVVTGTGDAVATAKVLSKFHK
jgi:large subunit ribosomal protein L10